MPNQLIILPAPGGAAAGGGARPRAQTDECILPDDLEITFWAESPMFFNPTNIDVDARGRVWVAERLRE